MGLLGWCHLIIASLTMASSLSSGSMQEPLKYCTHSKVVHFDSFRKFDDPYNLTYWLLLTRSYISSDPSEKGLLSQWTFSNNGHVLRARVNERAVWQDGSTLSSTEAAVGIAYGLSKRDISKKIRVKGIENINEGNLDPSQVDGIKVLGPRDFELHFEANVKKAAGVIKEALSTNSRQNRIWPMHLHWSGGKLVVRDKFDLISKYPVQEKHHKYIVSIQKQRIALAPERKCADSDFFPVSLPQEANPKKFTYKQASNPQALVAVVSKKYKIFRAIETRRATMLWLRQAVEQFSKEYPSLISTVDAHFEKNEPGYQPGLAWPSSKGLKTAKIPRLIKISTYLPKSHVIYQIIERASKREHTRIKWLPFESEQAHIVITSSKIQKGRRIDLQDWASTKQIFYFNDHPATLAALKSIRKNSSATMPIKVANLRRLENASLKEISMIPLGRVFPSFYSKRTTDIEIVTTEFDELQIRRR